MRTVLPETVLVTARKGTFGHGMGACGRLGADRAVPRLRAGRALPHPVAARASCNAAIAAVHQRFVFDQPQPAPQGLAGKLSMGIGGVNACVISRPW